MAGANTLQLNPNSSYGTGILTAQELAKLNLQKTQLAVLSACQTGVGEITIEGVSGLQRAFKRAGVRSLLVSLWEVNDAVTATLMTTFYKALMAGYPFNEAFVIAIDTVRQSTFTINGVKTSGDDISLYGAFVLID
jgi:CHAT domain-containing protein